MKEMKKEHLMKNPTILDNINTKRGMLHACSHPTFNDLPTEFFHLWQNEVDAFLKKYPI